MRRRRAEHTADSSIRFAKELWPNQVQTTQVWQLSKLVETWHFSVAAGDLQLLAGRWYVTHSGLLRLAHRLHCSGMKTETVNEFCEPHSSRWVVKATVYKSPTSRGFVGYGDADPSNVSPKMRGAEMRIAETRAVNRALRKAYGIGLCSVDELGSGAGPISSPPLHVARPAEGHKSNDSGNGQPRLRDRLLLLIREYHLDAEQVKRYATHFCATKSLRDATRDQVEKLVLHLEQVAAQGREQLLTELASFSEATTRPPETPIDTQKPIYKEAP